ncbi:MAG TPA: magnesium/cobalt transporter CorA [Usitatibacter sp.]|jgi:magnesium transporter|nr:magnesium/cobalt transporter CorA [Usitatibacter sp.]
MLVNCAAYQDGHKLADIAKEAISDYVQRPDVFVWVALKDPTPDELEEMGREFNLHELAVEDALHGHQRPKIDEYGTSLFCVLHVPEMQGDDVEVGEIDIFVGPNYILSVRQRTQHGFGEVRARAESEPELLKNGSGFVFYALMDNVVDRYFPLVDQLEVELEKIEERIFAGDSAKANIQALYALKHKGMVIRHAVEPLIEAVHKLYGGRVPQVCSGTQEYFRDVYDHLLRVSQQLDGLRDMVITAMQVNLSMISLSENEVTKRLAAYAALVAVPTMVAGIYGMNFKNMPELDWVFGYPMSIAIMIAIDAYLWAKFRRTGWL